MTQRVLIVVGSRPEAVKMAPIFMAMRGRPESFEPVLCSTGQQLHMIPQALAEFGLTPDLSLDVMQPDQTLAELTARLMTQLDRAITTERPDWVLVQGDTTSAMTAALAGFYRRVPVGHVEAGMRTHDQFSPFPEEVNRRVISQCATLHFAPTARCESNLLAEGVPAGRVHVTGNTVIDALLWTRERVREAGPPLPAEVRERLGARRLVLVTSHRRESFGRGLENICLALRDLGRALDDVLLVFPVHPNPRVRGPVLSILGAEPNVLLVEPQPYRSFVGLMDGSELILTDSGGLQEEAPSLGKPVLVLRETTERPEGVEAGCARLVGTSRREITGAAVELLSDPAAYARMTGAPDIYGDGRAAPRIASILSKAAAAPDPAAAPVTQEVTDTNTEVREEVLV